MITQMRWIDRKFNFDFEAGVYPSIIERLRGTPLRVTNLLKDLPEELLTLQSENKWSLKERVGHLFTVESLWEKRIDQYLQGVTELVAADMSNQKTVQANFNNITIDELLRMFTDFREKFIYKLEALTETDIVRSAFHPRLQTDMRLVDLLYFAAEHDDQELALMRALISTYA